MPEGVPWFEVPGGHAGLHLGERRRPYLVRDPLHRHALRRAVIAQSRPCYDAWTSRIIESRG